MKKCFHAIIPIILGLVAAQVIATLQVHLSNAHLYGSLVLIKEAGYLIVPNQHIMPCLHAWGPAFLGGLFFTLTIGAGLSIVSFSAAWSWDRLFRKRKFFAIFLLILWMGCLVSLNLRGLILLAGMYFLVIPPLVFWSTLRWLPQERRKQSGYKGVLHVIPLLVLALLWGSQADKRLFLDLRDYLLLSNPPGARINDFYYDYTLYPAEVFKPLHQRLLKTAILEDVQKKPIVAALKRTLLDNDYLVVETTSPVDLRIHQGGGGFLLEHQGRTVLRTTLQEFVSKPGAMLREFSYKCDRYAFFRLLTFYSLLVAFPITLYLVLHAFICMLLRAFSSRRASLVIASLLCFLIGVSLWLFFQHQRPGPVEPKNLAQALDSRRWQERVAALRLIEEKHIEIAEFQGHGKLLSSPHVPERYWLARALGMSRRPETYNDLLNFLEDPHLNVVSIAFYALGRRGDRRAVPEIIKRIETSQHWYNQWHAYKALRTLGWKQSQSD